MMAWHFYGDRIEPVIRDNGERILVVPFIPKFYTSPETTRLSKVYDISSHHGSIVSSSMGNAGDESFAGDLFKFYQAIGQLVGVASEDMANYAEVFNHKFCPGSLVGKEFLQKEGVAGIEVLFPTEALLINQKIPKRDPVLDF